MLPDTENQEELTPRMADMKNKQSREPRQLERDWAAQEEGMVGRCVRLACLKAAGVTSRG